MQPPLFSGLPESDLQELLDAEPLYVPLVQLMKMRRIMVPGPISCVIQILQICTRVKKSKYAIGFSKARRKERPDLFQWISIGIFQTLLLELADEDPPTAVVLSFPFDCLG